VHVVLFRPEIPPNTGNAMRLAANTGARLHLVRPLGFELDAARLRRAGLDYREWADVVVHDDLGSFLATVPHGRVLAFTRDGDTRHDDVAYRADDALLFGPESTGLPDDVLAAPEVAARVRIPMQPRSRSLNLANAVAVVLYEALRQQGFPGME
jgi:tRNA (cytidine/uridine-2'-O-)-methyltransferase